MLIGKPVLMYATATTTNHAECPCSFANKQDILSAATEFEVSKQMGLDDLAMCRHTVFPCIAKPSANANTVDERLHNGLHWLLQSMRTDYDRLNARIETQKVEWQVCKRFKELFVITSGAGRGEKQAAGNVEKTDCRKQEDQRRRREKENATASAGSNKH